MRKVEFEVAGEVTRFGVDHLRLAFLVGCLRHSLDTPVNFVNAPTLARERGILILENSQEEANYRQGEIRVRASERTGGKIHSIRGAVFGRDPRITAIEDVHLDLPLSGPLLATRHRDLPGVLGAIGQVLGRHQVNIRRLELGPSREGSEELAYGFLTLYSDPPKEAVAEVAQLEAIEQVQLIRL
jgi:D-3-phosphoglycerate dehydrogenase